MSRSIVLPSLLRTVALTLTACCLTLTLPTLALAQQALNVSESDGLLSVQASNTSASALAEGLATELGISVVVTGDAEALVNIDIVDEPLAKALAKLSPNHMLVRSSKEPDSSIVEVVLMMGEGENTSGSSGGDDQFLPSGSPAEETIVTEESIPTDDGGQQPGSGDANQLQASDPSNLQPEGDTPAPEAFDPVTGMPIDPLTGQPLE